MDRDERRTLPVLPLKTGVLFPTHSMPMTVGRPRSLAALEVALAGEDKNIVIASQKDPTNDEPGFEDLFEVATLGVIKGMMRAEGVMQAVVQGIARLRLHPVETRDTDALMARIELLPEPADTGPAVDALQREMLSVAKRIFELVKPEGLSLDQLLSGLTDPLHQAYTLAGLVGLDVAQENALLAVPTRAEGLRLMHQYLSHEAQVLELRHEIASEAQEKISKQQREFMLRQQMQAIQEELGEQEPEKAELEELRRRLAEIELPETARTELERELARLGRMPAAAADYQTTRSYIEFALELPWSETTEDRLDLIHAREVLDDDHYDLDDVKDRIIEHLAVMKLNPSAKAPILCFVGPPGVGKTSVGQSIARAIGRQFERMSLGGLHDEAELRGHRRTYIGAMPGRILQAIRRAESNNPVLMLDELDKLGRDFRGDPAAALMEILDPAQNSEFRDNYLNLPFDLSRVFFIGTANTLDSIPRPLLDRMEVLRLSGYSDEEKLQIARRYLVPRRLGDAGLSTEVLSLPDETLTRIIRRYTREAGVRELERMIGRIARKVATRFAGAPEKLEAKEQVVVGAADLAEMLGPERFFLTEMRDQMGPGVAAGLAWTQAGGEVLYVEAVLLNKSAKLTLTGQLGDVMKESATAARSYIQSHAAELGLDAEHIAEHGAHIHIPAGAIPKDGPSAGVTLVTALASLYGDRAVRRDTAMTGEITLSGLVLPVGGVREKVLAAHRSGMERVILPKPNEKDLRELPDEVRDHIEFVFAEHIEEVLAAAIPDLGAREPETQAASVH